MSFRKWKWSNQRINNFIIGTKTLQRNIISLFPSFVKEGNLKTAHVRPSVRQSVSPFVRAQISEMTGWINMNSGGPSYGGPTDWFTISFRPPLDCTRPRRRRRWRRRRRRRRRPSASALIYISRFLPEF